MTEGFISHPQEGIPESPIPDVTPGHQVCCEGNHAGSELELRGDTMGLHCARILWRFYGDIIMEI